LREASRLLLRIAERIVLGLAHLDTADFVDISLLVYRWSVGLAL
jgi:hypothetical protein